MMIFSSNLDVAAVLADDADERARHLEDKRRQRLGAGHGDDQAQALGRQLLGLAAAGHQTVQKQRQQPVCP